ncbi:MAG: HAD-IA family hydrolase [Paracoccaceae bacterium]
MHRIRCIAWDFDGVLNRGIENGRFVWQDKLTAAFGIDAALFAQKVFGDFWPVMRGEKDVLDHLRDWQAHVGYQGEVEEILHFWFREDAKPCADMLGLVAQVRRAGLLQVIATNNEHRRTEFIETEMGFSRHMDAVFSSGRMKVAKPDAGYFRHIEDQLGLEPDQIMLVDDHAENVAAAQACGWHVHHFPEDGHGALAQRLRAIL